MCFLVDETVLYSRSSYCFIELTKVCLIPPSHRIQILVILSVDHYIHVPSDYGELLKVNPWCACTAMIAVLVCVCICRFVSVCLMPYFSDIVSLSTDSLFRDVADTPIKP